MFISHLLFSMAHLKILNKKTKKYVILNIQMYLNNTAKYSCKIIFELKLKLNAKAAAEHLYKIKFPTGAGISLDNESAM